MLFFYLFVWLDFGELDLWPHTDTIVTNMPKLSKVESFCKQNEWI